MSLALPAAWAKTLPHAAEQLSPLAKFLEEEAAAGHVLAPPREQIFAALEATPPEAVKVVLLGQDPYPTKGHAHGLAFSVARAVNKIPGSLRNIYALVAAELGVEKPKVCDLTCWAKSGVLLLNTVLTVREGDANSHAKKGWEPFTRGVLEAVANRTTPTAFLLFGKSAEALAPVVEKPQHLVVKGPHPSPLNGRAFVEWGAKEKPLSKVNAFLEQHGRGAVDWRVV